MGAVDFFEVVANRRSVRAFARREIEPDKLRQVLAAADAAPSAGNLQAYQIYAVRQPAKRRALAHLCLGQMFLAEAPVDLVFCAVPDRSAAKYRARGRDLYCLQDATIACAYAQLAATALGLGSVWVGAFEEGALRRELGLPPGEVPIAVLALGYAAETPEPTARRQLDDLAREV